MARGLMTRDQLNRVLDPEAMTGRSDASAVASA
jgi:hypothetical protein